MNQLEWARIEELHSDEFGSAMRGSRWRQKFGALPYDIVERAMLLHAETSNSRPTVGNLIDCLPKGQARHGRPDHVHGWEEFPLTTPDVPAARTQERWEWEQSGPREVVCLTCGSHNRLRCQCERCLCGHVNRRRLSRTWAECQDCGGAIRVKGE